MIDHDPVVAQVGGLATAISSRISARGEIVAAASNKATLPLLLWIDYLEKSEITGCADELLDGLRASAVETTTCLTVGFVRPAIFSMRSEIDILFSWLYFKDHPIEWSRVVSTGNGFKLKSEVSEYMDEHYVGFRKRLTSLCDDPARGNEDPYRLLSSFVHSQSPSSLPQYEKMDAVVWADSKVMEGVALQSKVVGYICDTLLSTFYLKWNSLPTGVQAMYSQCNSATMAKVLTHQ